MVQSGWVHTFLSWPLSMPSETMASVGVLARFELRPFRLLRGVGLLRLDLDVLAAGNDLAALLLLAVSRADLHKLRLRCDLLLQERFDLHGIAIRIGALRFIVGRPFCEEQLIVSGAFGAIDTASCGWYELGIALVERCLFQEQEDVMLYPMLEMADG